MFKFCYKAEEVQSFLDCIGVQSELEWNRLFDSSLGNNNLENDCLFNDVPNPVVYAEAECVNDNQVVSIYTGFDSNSDKFFDGYFDLPCDVDINNYIPRLVESLLEYDLSWTAAIRNIEQAINIKLLDDYSFRTRYENSLSRCRIDERDDNPLMLILDTGILMGVVDSIKTIDYTQNPHNMCYVRYLSMVQKLINDPNYINSLHFNHKETAILKYNYKKRLHYCEL